MNIVYVHVKSIKSQLLQLEYLRYKNNKIIKWLVNNNLYKQFNQQVSELIFNIFIFLFLVQVRINHNIHF